MSAALLRIAELVRRETGVVTSDSQLSALAAALGRVAAGMDAERFLGELGAPARGGPLIARLVDEVTVKETYLFREPAELRAVDWPQLCRAAVASGSDAVRVWVSACATGEEAYTMAILACEALGTPRPPVAILATDVSNAAVERAVAASYTERAVRNVPAALRARYFVRDAGRYVVTPAVRSLVRVRRHNLLTDPSPPVGEVPFEVITCRNVLIYFDHDTVEQVIGSLGAALRAGGQLILGAADRLSGTASRLGRASLAVQPAEGRRRRPSPRDQRRPLGREDPRSHNSAGPGPFAASGRRRPTPGRSAGDRVQDALWAADAGDLQDTLAIIAQVLAAEPSNADAYFVRGLAELGLGDSDGAATSFRRALYVDSRFGLAAFQLGRAHDARRDGGAARRAYAQALRTLDPDDDRHRAILDKVDLGDIAAACRARLRA